MFNSITEIEYQIEYDFFYGIVDDVYGRKIIKKSSIISSIIQDIKTSSISESNEIIYKNFFKFLKELHFNNCISDYKLDLEDYLGETILFRNNQEEKVEVLRNIYNDFTSELIGDYFEIKTEIKKFINEKK